MTITFICNQSLLDGMEWFDMFEIYDISSYQDDEIEHLGTKSKFWYFDKEEQKWRLFKSIQSKEHMRYGEDWAEKIACELAKLLRLPYADYELATYKGYRGVISTKFISDDKGEQLTLGNELLRPFVGGSDDDNPNLQYIDDVYEVMTKTIKHKPIGFKSDINIKTASEFFLGYLMFDVLISNQDRHNENWGCVVTLKGKKHLAPSYDHGASLARNESDETRKRRLESKDIGQKIETYVKRAKSHFQDKESKNRIKLIECFKLYAEKEPNAKKAWLNRLNQISDDDIYAIIQKIPDELMSEIAKTFTYQLILANKKSLCDLI